MRDGNRAAKNLKEHKLLFLDEGGQAFFIEKNPNDTATENYKNRLFRRPVLFKPGAGADG